jgi:hypothetical protein
VDGHVPTLLHRDLVEGSDVVVTDGLRRLLADLG